MPVRSRPRAANKLLVSLGFRSENRFAYDANRAPGHRSLQIRQAAECIGRASLVVSAMFIASQDVNAYAVESFGKDLLIPVVVWTGSYTSRVHVFNATTQPATITVKYYGGLITATPGETTCNTIVLQPNATANYNLSVLCPLTLTGGNFGMLRISSDTAVSAYSRVSNPQGNGFSVEGLPTASFYGADLNVLGLKRSAISPGYTSNCFVGTLEQSAKYSIQLFDKSGAPIGTRMSGILGPNEIVRHLDIFSAAGLSATEVSDVRAEIGSAALGNRPLIAFCTVQNNSNFDADFRLGKPRSETGALSVKKSKTAPVHPFTARIAHRFASTLRAPDVVQCSVDGDQASMLQMRLVSAAGTPVAGGQASGSFQYVLGPRSSINGGKNAYWYIEITPRTSVQQFPLAYSFSCASGNGMTRPIQLQDTPAF